MIRYKTITDNWIKFGNCKITISPPGYKTIAAAAAHFPECVTSQTSQSWAVVYCVYCVGVTLKMCIDIIPCYCWCHMHTVCNVYPPSPTLLLLLLLYAQAVCQSLLVIAMGGKSWIAIALWNIARHCRLLQEIGIVIPFYLHCTFSYEIKTIMFLAFAECSCSGVYFSVL